MTLFIVLPKELKRLLSMDADVNFCDFDYHASEGFQKIMLLMDAVDNDSISCFNNLWQNVLFHPIEGK